MYGLASRDAGDAANSLQILLPLGLLCRELSKFSVRLSVVRPSVRPSVRPCQDQFWTINPPKAPGGVPVRVQKQVRFGHFAESTRVSDGSNVPLVQFRDLLTQSVQGPPLPCGCNLVIGYVAAWIK